MPHQGRSTHESAPPLKGAPPYSCFEGNQTHKSEASPPVARRERAWKRPLHGWENFHHQGAVQQPVQQDLCSNVPSGVFWECREAITLPTSWLVGGVPSGADTSSFLQERGETGVWVYQEDMLQGAVKHLSITLCSGQEWVFQQDSLPPQKAIQLTNGCTGSFRPINTDKNLSSGNRVFPCRQMNSQTWWS